eukprot:Gregarina_sp_Poly_1__3879@NODE_215_length_11293_cov_58_142259_g191_i0_p3_GENE_NODE_215_length_11293_cov_58_142259_g191_i0NODE_215_length_11293_cov_58_142259_g191_i0_p3_ORF_typecomplete_len369_score52_74C2/PF00168_30/2_6e07_NODE_215_length_11293_cov_58_142259_g191_i039035009
MNFYWRPPSDELQSQWKGVRDLASTIMQKTAGTSLLCLPWDVTPVEISHPTAYAGRVLITAVANRVQIPSVITSTPSGSASGPPARLWLFDCQIFEVASISGNIGPLRVEIAIGPHAVSSNPMPFISDSYKFPADEENETKLGTLKIYMPPLEESWDLFLYVQANIATNVLGIGQAADVQRAAYARMPLRQAQMMQQKPFWTSLLALDTNMEAFRLLMACRIGEESQLASQNQFKMDYKVRDYMFRAFVYEAVNLPCPDSGEYFPSALVRVELGGKTFLTRFVKSNINPSYYEAFEDKVSLQEDLSLAPEINIDIFHKASGFFATDEHIGHTTFLLADTPQSWESYPRWLTLKHPQEKSDAVGHSFNS